jgi:hypothetical protein
LTDPVVCPACKEVLSGSNGHDFNRLPDLMGISIMMCPNLPPDTIMMIKGVTRARSRHSG